MVLRVKLCPCPRLVRLLEHSVISGKESSSSTCSWSSTMYTPVQFTAMITSFFGRLGPANLREGKREVCSERYRQVFLAKMCSKNSLMVLF